MVALLEAERHEGPGAPLNHLQELSVGVAQIAVGVDKRLVVRAALGDEIQEPPDGQSLDVLGAHAILLPSVPKLGSSVGTRTNPRKQ